MTTPSLPEIRPAEPSPARVRELVPADSTRAEMDAALAILRAQVRPWAELAISDRRAILQELIKDFGEVAGRWSDACGRAEGLTGPAAGEKWLTGPYMILRNMALLERTLGEIERYGKPKIPGPVKTRPNGTTTARVFPTDGWDSLFYSGVVGEVWMQPGVTPDSLPSTMATAYAEADDSSSGAGGLCLVLGAGNVSSIGPMDLLSKLFVDRQVTLLKIHPVNAFLGPLIEEGMRALVDWGVLRVVYGGVETGEYLCGHREVDEIHITGSDKTVEAIVFGTGEEGEKRRRERRPRNTKPISSELGNVSPVIVVPGPWSQSDLAYQSENISSMLTNNAGFNCNAARVLIQHSGWEKRQALLDTVREQLAETPSRYAYYPGAVDRWRAFVAEHPEAEALSVAADGELPWTLISDVDPAKRDDICFQQEAFCGVFAETALEAESPADFLDRAVSFCNDTLWGTLNATILVHPVSLRDKETRAAFERALDDLNYGTVAVNAWAAIGYGLVVTPWGAPPGHDLYDIQSGSGLVHNTLMFDRVQKTVVRVPFRMWPKPVWFRSHRTARAMAEKVTRFEQGPSLTKLPGIFWEALRG
ncbi:MAG: aldehyde dehydrogenase family protein [Acidobacteriota bacterium]